MPVDLSIGSGIINAYLAGLRERREKEKDISDKQATADALKEHSRQFDLKQKQENEHFDKTFKAESAVRALTALQMRAALQRHVEETGSLPPGATELLKTNTSPQEDIDSLNAGTYNSPEMRGQLRPGMTGPSVTRDIQLPDELGSMTALDPISAALRDAQREQILQAPKTNEAIRQATGIKSAEHPFLMDMERLKNTDVKSLQDQKDIAAMARAKLLDDGRARDARTRAASKVTGGANKHLNTYLSTDDLTRYGMPQGTKYKDIQGMSPGKILSPTENDKVNVLAAIGENLNHITTLGDEIGWKGIGPVSGRVGGLLTSVNMGNDKEEELRQSFANLKSDIGLMRSGKAFTKNEERIIDEFVGTGTSSSQKLKVALGRLVPVIDSAKKRIFHPESLIKGGSNNAGGGDNIVDQLVNKHLGK